MNQTMKTQRIAAWIGFLAITHASVAAEPEPAWRQRAAATVESHRKATLAVEVVDEHGVGVPGARVAVRQLTHDFQWCAPAPAAGTGRLPLFNTVRMVRRPNEDMAAFEDAFRKASRDGLRVHAAWHGGGGSTDGATAWTEVAAWDLPRSTSAAGRDAVVRSLRHASPFARLFWPCGDMGGPDGRTRVAAARGEALQLAQQGFGVDGLVAEFRTAPMAGDPEDWLALLDEGADAQGKAAQLTWHVVARLQGADHGAAEASRLSDLLWVAFGHPAVTGISVHAGDGAGNPLLDSGGLTAAGVAWSNLVCVAWTTRADARTSISGRAELRVFRGEHEVLVEHGGQRFNERAVVSADAVARVVVPVTRPMLAAQPGALVKFTWPAQASGFVLEWSEDPTAGPWTRCETFAVRGRDAWRQEAGAASAARFYRLRRGGSEPE